MPLFTLEGVVGAGKTSLLQALQHAQFKTKHIVVLEPVDVWMKTKPGGPDSLSLFEKYYADKNRYGFMFQMFTLQTRVADLLNVVNAHHDKIIICERSYISDCEIFAQMMFDMSILTKEEYHVYKEWYNMCVQHLFPKFQGAIFLDTTPSKCIDRIMSRARAGEENISFDYIKRLHTLHDKWVKNTSIPVCMIDGNTSIMDVNNYKTAIDKVVEFCNSFV